MYCDRYLYFVGGGLVFLLLFHTHALKACLQVSASQACFSVFKQVSPVPAKEKRKTTSQSSPVSLLLINTGMSQRDTQTSPLDCCIPLHSKPRVIVLALWCCCYACWIDINSLPTGEQYSRLQTGLYPLEWFSAWFWSEKEQEDILIYTTMSTDMFHPKSHAGYVWGFFPSLLDCSHPKVPNSCSAVTGCNAAKPFSAGCE